MFCNLDCCKEGPVNQQKEVLQKNMKLFFFSWFWCFYFFFSFFLQKYPSPLLFSTQQWADLILTVALHFFSKYKYIYNKYKKQTPFASKQFAFLSDVRDLIIETRTGCSVLTCWKNLNNSVPLSSDSFNLNIFKNQFWACSDFIFT